MKKLTIYTDGSHFKGSGSGRLGIGGLIVINNKVMDKFSTEITPDYLLKNYGTSDCSNPTMEMLAVLFALRKFSKFIKPKDIVTLKFDYQGVEKFCNGDWKIKKSYIAKIKNEIDLELEKLDIINSVEFCWVPSHQKGNTPDIVFNNMVDLLSKGELN